VRPRSTNCVIRRANEQLMATVRESAIIPGPIDAVFDTIADYGNVLTWLEGFTRFDLLPGPVRGRGARVRAEGRFLSFFR